MGKPSDKRLSAQRPSKRDRARVKKRSRVTVSHGSRAGWITLTAGRKKMREAHMSRTSPFSVYRWQTTPSMGSRRDPESRSNEEPEGVT